MPHTVAAIFESESQANQARSELISLGIPSDDIFVRNDTGQAQRASSTEDADEGTGIAGFFKRLFGFDDEEDDRTTYYSRAIGEGRYLVAVDASTDDQAERAADMMQRLGALDIDDDIGDLDVSRGPARPGAQADTAPMSDEIPVLGHAKTPAVEEDLQAGKRTLRRGGVRVYARAYDIPVEEKIRLREERAAVNRRPADRPATEADLAALNQGRTLEVSERVEEPIVGKRVRFVEEAGKQVNERMENRRDKVRKTDLSVGQLAAEEKPRQHPHLETMEDDPYTPTPSDESKQSQ
jgi:stress response protein YsnF